MGREIITIDFGFEEFVSPDSIDDLSTDVYNSWHKSIHSIK